MPERCTNCGSELLAGQRFCRYCGTPTDLVGEDSNPTQMMPPQGDTEESRGKVNTAPTSRPETSPVYPPRTNYPGGEYPPQSGYVPGAGMPAYYRQPYPPAPYGQPPSSRKAWGWILALGGIGLFGIMVLSIFLIVASSGGSNRRTITPPVPPTLPSPPSIPGMVGGGTDFGNAGAEIRGSETIITRTFSLAPGGTLNLSNLNGSIEIEGWDEEQAEVEVTKSGGSPEDRENVEVSYSLENGVLTLKTAPRSGARNIEVAYRIKLPRKMAQVQLAGMNTSVTLSDLEGAVSVKTLSGSIEISDLRGDVKAETTSGRVNLNDIAGDVKAKTASGAIELNDVTGAIDVATASGRINGTIDAPVAGKAMTFETVSGNIELQFGDKVNAEFKARTISGRIELPDWGVQVRQRVPGQAAEGRIGAGGAALSVNTVSGNIKITQ